MIGNATNNPAHLESNCLDNNVAPTTTAPDNTNCNTIWYVFICDLLDILFSSALACQVASAFYVATQRPLVHQSSHSQPHTCSL